MNTLDATRARVYWLDLPPLRKNEREEAARVRLRGKVAAPARARISVAEAAHSSGRWCATIAEADALSALNGQTVPEAALLPWKPGEIAWHFDARAPYFLSASGESIPLGAYASDELPGEIISACAAGAKRVTVYSAGATAAQGITARLPLWRAQLGVPVEQATLAPFRGDIATLPRLDRATPLVAPPATTVAPARWPLRLALLAGVAQLAFGGVQWASAQRTRAELESRAQQIGRTLSATPATWRATLAAQHPHAARERLASTLDIAMPAIGSSASQLKSLHYENNALSLEWTKLDDAARSAIAARVEAHGASTLGAGNKLRVVWP